jgi:hypothetical protein
MPPSNASRSSSIDDDLLNDLQKSLNTARVCISSSTELLRKAYTHDPSLNTTETISFRRRLYSEGLMYGCHVYPNSHELVKAVKSILENYVYLDYADFIECLNEIRRDCLKHSTTAYKAQIKHTYVLENLKQLQDDMEKSANSLKEARQQHEQSVEKISARGFGAASIAQGAFGAAEAALAVAEFTSPVPVAVPVALVALGLGSLFYAVSLIGDFQQATNNVKVVSASSTVLKGLLESLGDLLQAVDLIAGFMAVMANELDEISKTGIDEDMSKRHWKIMTKKGQTLVNSCNGFIAIEPKITSDLRSIKDTLEVGFEDSWIKRLRLFEMANAKVPGQQLGKITEI